MPCCLQSLNTSSVPGLGWPHPLGTRGPQGGFSLNVLIFRGALQGRAIALALCDTLHPGDGPRGRWGWWQRADPGSRERSQPAPVGRALNPSLCCWSCDAIHPLPLPQCKCLGTPGRAGTGMMGLELCSFHAHSLLSPSRGCSLPFAFHHAGSVPHLWKPQPS